MELDTKKVWEKLRNLIQSKGRKPVRKVYELSFEELGEELNIKDLEYVRVVPQSRKILIGGK